MKLKKIVSDTLKYWYIYILALCVVEIINLGVLSLFTPTKVCFWISAFLVFLFLGYLCLTISVVYDNLRMLLRKKEDEWNQAIDELKKHIDELDEENKELSKELAKSLGEDINSGNDTVIRTIQTDLLDGKERIINEVHERSSALTETINKSAKTLVEKSEDLIELQNKCTEKIINNEKTIATENSEFIKGKVDFLSEQSETLIKTLSIELKNAGKENTDNIILETNANSKVALETICKNHEESTEQRLQHHSDVVAAIKNVENMVVSGTAETAVAVKNIDEKFDEKFTQAEERNSTHNAAIMQTLNDNQSELNAGLEHIKDDIAKELKKSDDIISIGNSIIERQQMDSEESKKEFANLSERHNVQFTEVKEVLCMAITENAEKELKEILDCKEQLSESISEAAKKQIAIKEELELKLIEKVRELIQESSEEIKENINTNIGEINAYHREMKEIYKANNEKLEGKAVVIHSETTKLINLLLDNMEESSEKNERYINLLGNQISDLNKQSKNSISALMNEIEKSKEQTETFANKLAEYADAQKKDVGDSEKRIQEHIKSLSTFYSNYFNKIDNIQAEIRSVSHAINLLNSLYSKLQESIKNSNGKDSRADSEKTERVEEYKDPESGAVVKNHYKKDKLSFSEMIVAGRKTYDVQYDGEGKAEKSRNYNERGEIISEIEFYKSGQVKVRKEILVKNGKKESVISRFDEKGNKLK